MHETPIMVNKETQHEINRISLDDVDLSEEEPKSIKNIRLNKDDQKQITNNRDLSQKNII